VRKSVKLLFASSLGADIFPNKANKKKGVVLEGEDLAEEGSSAGV
jgi:hypothetical protein